MTFETLKAETFRRLEESSAAPVFYSEDDVETALNEGLMEISDATEWREIYRTVDLLHTRPYYDVRTVFADDEILSLGRAFHEDTSRWLDPCSPRDLDARYRRWERVRAVPDRIQRRGLWWVGYYPITGSESGTVKQFATALPGAMDADDDEPGFPEVFHLGIVEYALSELWPEAGEVTKALEAWQAYLLYEAGLTAHVGGRGQVPQWRGYGR